MWRAGYSDEMRSPVRISFIRLCRNNLDGPGTPRDDVEVHASALVVGACPRAAPAGFDGTVNPVQIATGETGVGELALASRGGAVICPLNIPACGNCEYLGVLYA